MIFNFCKKPISEYEAFIYLQSIINDNTPHDLYNRINEQNIPDDALLGKRIELHDKIKYKPESELLRRCLKNWLNDTKYSVSTAFVILDDYLPNSINTVLDNYKAVPPTDREVFICTRFKNSLSDYLNISEAETITNYGDFLTILDSSELESEIKLEILFGCFNYEKMLVALLEAIELVAAEIEPLLADFYDLTEATIGEFEMRKDFFYDYVKEATGIVIAATNCDEIYVYPSVLLRGFSVDVSSSDPAALIVIIDFRIIEIVKMSEILRASSGIEALRTLVEKTKFEIISAIAKKPMYGSEIAELLGLTSATVSHHVNDLLRNNLIAVDVQKRRAYYSPNRLGIKKAIEPIERLIDELKKMN